MTSKNTLLSIVFMFFAINCFAIPANNKVVTKKQSNGKRISFILKGNEFLSWANSLDGYTLLGNKNGDYVYAIINKEGNLVPSEVLATNPEERTIEDKLFLNKIKPNLTFSASQIAKVKLREVRSKALPSIERAPTTGTPNFLVILVNFSDFAFDTSNVRIVRDQINVSNYTNNGRTGSVKDYFFDNSMGQLDANFTVVGPYTLPHNQAYYGSNDAYGVDSLPQYMIYDACVLANNDVNFQDFDNDGDGIVDMIHVVYAGQGEHTGGGANAIWPHSWILPSNSILDNVQLQSYSCSSELYNASACDGIGPICHEMGHVLGLPDFYDTDYSGSGGTSIEVMYWDLMSSGGYNNDCITPPNLSAVERNLLGWLNPTIISTNNTNCILPAISDSNMVYKINLQDDEFLIFEHRNKKKWDAYTPGKGMLVFHGDQSFIDNWIIGRNNAINANPFDRGLFIIPSCGDSTNIDSDSTTFPGSRNVNSLLNITHKNGNPTGVNLTNIGYTSDSTITFNLANIYPNISISSPTNITMNSATLNGSAIGTDITSMGFEYRMVGDTAYTSQTISTSTMQFNLTNLLAGTTYEYRVFGIKNSITYYTSIIEFNTICLTNLTIPYSQGFEVATLPCWGYQSSNNNFISIETVGNVPYCLPHSGNRMIKYGSGYLEYGNWATITTPVIYIPHQYHQFSFWIYRLSGSYSSPNEGVEIYINSNNDLNGATLLGYISNNRNTTPIETSDGWYNYSFNLPSGTYGNKYFIIKTLSDFGYNIYIDDISITPYLTQIPPMVFMDSVSSITTNSADLYGLYIQGTDSILTQGFEYKLNADTSWSSITTSTGTAQFNYLLSGLSVNTKYNVRAFITTQTEGTTYSTINTFTTDSVELGEVLTNEASGITNSSAVLNGTLVSTGYATSNIELGFVYSNTTNPLIGDTNVYKVIIPYTSGMTSFDTIITTFYPSTTYAKAYITNSAGTYYGEEININYSGLSNVNNNQLNIQLYPNPATSSTKLIVNGISGETQIIINDIQGRTINTTKNNPLNGQIEQTIDLTKLSRGIYFINIKNSTNSKAEKLIVQ